jgi:cephalosporin hydroxylase
MRTIFERIEHVWQHTQGWASWTKAETMAAIVLATRPKVSIEIGIFFGRSFLPVALAHQHVNCGKAIAIDPWLKGCSIEGEDDPKNVEWWNRQDIHEMAHDDFRSKVRELNLAPFVEIHRMHSDEYDPKAEIGLLHIDGNHREQAIKDFARYAPNVVKGGYLIADDLNWTGGAVSRAVALLPGMGFEELYRVEKRGTPPHEPDDSWAVFRKL